MLWWFLAGGLVVSLIVLALAVRPLIVRLPALERALRRLNDRAEQAQHLAVAAERLQERVEAVQAQLEAQLAARQKGR